MSKTTTTSSPIEAVLGKSLMTRVGKTVQTQTALKDAELVCLYFSASWCPPCQRFTPILINFYNKACASSKVAIVYVSSDRNSESFTKYYGKMPWLAIPPESAEIKQNLSDGLSIFGIPALMVLDAKTGYYVTDTARDDVASIGDGNDEAKAKAVIASWREKAKNAVPISQAKFSKSGGMLSQMVSYILKHPAFIFAFLFFAKRVYKYFLQLGQEDDKEF